MPARTGTEYLQRLKEHCPEVWLGDERVHDVTTHPALRRGARSVAHLYDMQHDPALREEMTYISPTTGDRVGLSFITPHTIEDLRHRTRMMLHWARYSGGMMGRSPDYLNVNLMACAAAAEFYAQNDPRHAENVRHYYTYICENDLCLTHTLVNPQANRALTATGHPSAEVAARIVKETDKGMVIRGARILATLGPLSDEIAVFPSTVLKAAADTAPYAFAFAIPSDTPGLKYICRESFDYGRPASEHPLGSRFEEMDAIVVFDDVLVPWERVFLKADPVLCNASYAATNAVVHMMHQVVVKNIAKAEFILGVACLIVDALGATEFPHVHEKIAECIVNLELMKACLRAGEADAAIDRWGVMCPHRPPLDVARNVFPKMYPRMVEILQLLSSSGMMMIPPQSAFDSPIGDDIDRYLVVANMSAQDRVKLFRLAWDIACSAFGGRQTLYERFFFGDPMRMASALYGIYPKEPLMDRVREFLARSDEDSFA
jgi:4-hydroxyphenylacetate 3-monooxygenase